MLTLMTARHLGATKLLLAPVVGPRSPRLPCPRHPTIGFWRATGAWSVSQVAVKPK